MSAPATPAGMLCHARRTGARRRRGDRPRLPCGGPGRDRTRSGVGPAHRRHRRRHLSRIGRGCDAAPGHPGRRPGGHRRGRRARRQPACGGSGAQPAPRVPPGHPAVAGRPAAPPAQPRADRHVAAPPVATRPGERGRQRHPRRHPRPDRARKCTRRGARVAVARRRPVGVHGAPERPPPCGPRPRPDGAALAGRGRIVCDPRLLPAGEDRQGDLHRRRRALADQRRCPPAVAPRPGDRRVPHVGAPARPARRCQLGAPARAGQGPDRAQAPAGGGHPLGAHRARARGHRRPGLRLHERRPRHRHRGRRVPRHRRAAAGARRADADGRPGRPHPARGRGARPQASVPTDRPPAGAPPAR